MQEVHFINQKPITFSSQVSGSNSLNVEIRILVLSSQHEDMLFRVKFEIFNSQKEKMVTLYSEPLRVISKVDSGKKKQKGTKATNSVFTQIQQTSSKAIKVTPTQREMITSPLKENQLDTRNIIDALKKQQNMLKEISNQYASNPLTYPLMCTLNSYLNISQTQRIPQLLRFISELSPPENNAINELVEVYKEYKRIKKEEEEELERQRQLEEEEQ